MPWGGDVISNAVILSCPVAACYAARVISKLTVQPEHSLLWARNRSVPALPVTFGQCERKRFREGDDVLQYSNATFSYESQRHEEVDSSDCEDDDLNFFMMTPQQAQGALGDHATHYKKIYINGLTYIEQSDEQGLVVDNLSLDEYACRIQSVVKTGLHSSDSLSSRSSPCLTPTAAGCFRLADTSCCATDSCSVSTLSSSCYSMVSSALVSMHDGLGGGSLSRTSLDEQHKCSSSMASSPREHSTAEQCAACATAPRVQPRSMLQKGCCTDEAVDCGATVLWQSVPQVHWPSSTSTSVLQSRLSMSCRAAGEGTSTQAPGSSSSTWQVTGAVDAPAEMATEAEAAVTSPRAAVPTCTAYISSTVRSVGHRASGGSDGKPSGALTVHHQSLQQPRPCGAREEAKKGTPNRCQSSSLAAAPATKGTLHTVSSCPRAGAADKAHQRRELMSASCAATPMPLPTPDPRSAALLAHLSVPVRSQSLGQVRSPFEAAALHRHASCPQAEQPQTSPTCCADPALAAPRLRPAAQALYPRTTQGGATPAAHAACSPAAGLSKAPALPLPIPDTTPVDGNIPPALRYYLAQARAVGAGEDEHSIQASDGGSCDPQGCEQQQQPECAMSQPGFVRAAVEQFNTQRLVRCHVTPFATAKTSRTPRTLSPRGSAVVVCK